MSNTGYRAWARIRYIGVNVGIGFNALSGTPLTPFAANPLYDSDGEIPEAPRERRVLLLADVFNLFNRRVPLDYDNYTEAAFGVLNPDFGRVIEYQDPIGARVGIRFDF